MITYQVLKEMDGVSSVRYYDDETGLEQNKSIRIGDCKSDAEILERYEQHLWSFEHRIKLGLVTHIGSKDFIDPDSIPKLPIEISQRVEDESK